MTSYDPVERIHSIHFSKYNNVGESAKVFPSLNDDKPIVSCELNRHSDMSVIKPRNDMSIITRSKLKQVKKNHRLSRQGVRRLSNIVQQLDDTSNNTKTFDEIKPSCCVIKTRQNPKITKILNSKTYNIIYVIFIVISIILHDINIMILPKQADIAIAIILLLITIIFIVDISIRSLYKSQYCLSNLFWLDILGILSLIPDFVDLFRTLTTGFGEYEIIGVGEEAKLPYHIHSFFLLQLLSAVRTIRVFRLANIFHFYSPHKKEKVYTNIYSKPSKLGKHLSELITEKMILIMFFMSLFVPLFTSRSYDSQMNLKNELSILEQTYEKSENDLFPILLQQFVGGNSEILYLQISDKVLIQNHNKLKSLRLIQMMDSSTTKSAVYINVKHSLTEAYGLQLAMSVVVIIIFMLGCFIINKSVYNLVVKPIERMTSMITKLAGTICILADENLSDEGSEDTEVDEDEDETKLLETVVSKMAELFDVQSTKTGGKADRLLTGSRTTEIRSRGAVYKVNVIESTDIGGPQDLNNLYHGIISDDIKKTAKQAQIDLEQNPELSSMQSVLSHPVATQVFKIFLAKKLNLENYMFWNEVEKFKTSTVQYANRISENFIISGATNQVNVSSLDRDTVLKSLETNQFPVTVFDHVQAIAFQLLDTNNFRDFLLSVECRNYVEKKKEDEIHIVVNTPLNH